MLTEIQFPELGSVVAALERLGYRHSARSEPSTDNPNVSIRVSQYRDETGSVIALIYPDNGWIYQDAVTSQLRQMGAL